MLVHFNFFAGARFAKMQTLVGLMVVLKSYKVELGKGMPEDVDLDPRTFLTQPRTGIHLKYTKRDGCEGRKFRRD